MRLVVVESPYGHKSDLVVARNVAYARACLADCLRRGEAPFASHLLYTQPDVLDDRDPEQRRQGIDAGFLWARFAEARVVYEDLGVSPGMEMGIMHAEECGQVVERRRLGAPWS